MKPILDAMREAKLIDDDKECDIDLRVTQTQVGTFAEEGTGVRITWP